MLIKTAALAFAALALISMQPAFAEADVGMINQNRDDLRGIQIERQNRQREWEDRSLAARQRAENEAARIRELRRRNFERDRRRSWQD